MSEQLSLPSFPGAQPPTDRLLFAIFPPAAVAAEMERTAQTLRTRHNLSGKPLARDRFHITLVHLGDYHGLPAGLTAEATAAGTAVSHPSFEIVFDRAGSFAAKSRSLPYVLRGDGGLARLMAFQQALGVELKKTGLHRFVGPQFTPHVTLLYDARLVPEEPLDPVGWPVTEFVLLHSLLGQTRYIELGRWSLG